MTSYDTENASRWEADMRGAAIVSVLFHTAVLMLLYFIQAGPSLHPASFVELSFSSPAPVKPVPPPVKLSEEEPEAPEMTTTAEPTAAQPEEPETPTQPVLLPPRRMEEPEPPEITHGPQGKITPDESQRRLEREAAEKVRTDLPTLLAELDAEREAARNDTLDYVPGQAVDEDVSESRTKKPRRTFEIEGEAAERTILSRVDPQYPPGLQREASVKIRFTLLPSGLVGEMIPVLKGDPALERVAFRVFRQWRFNALPPHAEQTPQTGIITFHFRLK